MSRIYSKIHETLATCSLEAIKQARVERVRAEARATYERDLAYRLSVVERDVQLAASLRETRSMTITARAHDVIVKRVQQACDRLFN